jgi:hypothetical protein
MDWTWFSKHWEAIGAVATVVGLFVSIYLGFRGRRRKPEVEVKMKDGFLTFTDGRLSDRMIFVEVSNTGEKIVTINVPYLQLPDNRKMVFPDPQSDVTFPHTLEEGKCCSLWVERKEVLRSLRGYGCKGKVRVRAAVADQTDKVYKARKVWKLNVEEKEKE